MNLVLEVPEPAVSHADLTRAGEAALQLGRRDDFGLVLAALANYWAAMGRPDLAKEISRYASEASGASRD